ncbi:hypothetical protein [Sulfitobacter aestuariivivens]|uniref:hypothetical protein n=1 Tax=Sulfitobacter aestuariivivens TaxID=2766981 RepID=UPI00360790A5
MTHMIRLIQITLMCLMVMSGTQTHAQVMLPGTNASESAVTLPDPLTTEAANALISRLSDSEVRSLLLDQLNTQATEEAEAASAGESEFVYHATTGAWSSVTTPIERLPLLYTGQATAFSNFFDRIGGGLGLVKLLGYMIVVFGIAAAAELVFRRLTRGGASCRPQMPTT